MAEYLVQNKISQFYWSLNPNSGDTGGLLQDDWKTPSQDKLDMLKSCGATDILQVLRTTQ